MHGGKAGQSEDTLSSLGKAPELILVMPDGNGRGGTTSEWGNSGDGKQLLENALVDDLVPYVDHKYRTLADAAHRGIGGLSMGGFGAAKLAFTIPISSALSSLSVAIIMPMASSGATIPPICVLIAPPMCS